MDEKMLITCPKCGRDQVEADARSPHMCVDCAKAENNRLTYYRQHQDDWMAVAKEAGIDVWERQPGETQWEFTVWTAYRDTYPGKPATYSQIARQLGTTTNVVKKIAQRWSFQLRMQQYILYCDQITMAQRHREILDMNAVHVDMAKKLNEKILKSIELLDPELVKPSEISGLVRTAAELERKARVDNLTQETLLRGASTLDASPEIKKRQTDVKDLSEIVKILAGAGALEGVSIKQTVTTEVSKDSPIDVSYIDTDDDE